MCFARWILSIVRLSLSSGSILPLPNHSHPSPPLLSLFFPPSVFSTACLSLFITSILPLPNHSHLSTLFFIVIIILELLFLCFSFLGLYFPLSCILYFSLLSTAPFLQLLSEIFSVFSHLFILLIVTCSFFSSLHFFLALFPLLPLFSIVHIFLPSVFSHLLAFSYRCLYPIQSFPLSTFSWLFFLSFHFFCNHRSYFSSVTVLFCLLFLTLFNLSLSTLFPGSLSSPSTLFSNHRSYFPSVTILTFIYFSLALSDLLFSPFHSFSWLYFLFFSFVFQP